MSEQKTYNKFEAIAAMVRDGVNLVYFGLPASNYICYHEGTLVQFNPPFHYSSVKLEDLPEHGYTIYQEPPKMKTYYKGYYKSKYGGRIFESSWEPNKELLETALNPGDIMITHEERQFPEVGV